MFQHNVLLWPPPSADAREQPMGLEYREQEEAFRQYREDSQLATKENQETIARLKEENEALKKVIELYLRDPLSAESNATLPEELCHHEEHLSGGTEHAVGVMQTSGICVMNVQRIGKECNALSNGQLYACWISSEFWSINIHNSTVRQHLL